MAEHEKCSNCGARMKQWWHTLTPGLVNNLIQMIKKVKEKKVNEIHLQQELNLSKTEYNNFQKLRYHGLIQKCTDKATGLHKKGYWLITDRGGKFLRNQMLVPLKVLTFRNKVVDHSKEVVGIREYRGKVTWFESEFDFDIREGMVVPVEAKQTLFDTI